MGWASASDIVIPIIKSMKKHVPVKERKKVYKVMYDAFRDADWDTAYELAGMDPVFDEILREDGEIDAEDSE